MTTNLLGDTEKGTKAENQPKKVSSQQLFSVDIPIKPKKNVYLLVVIEAFWFPGFSSCLILVFSAIQIFTKFILFEHF